MNIDINLDGIDDDDLREARTVFRWLEVYARHTLAARKLRRNGNIKLALERERMAQVAYDHLPASVRW